MIDKYFAELFVERIRKFTPFNFLIFSNEGIIIAANEKERVGVFHEASYKMMREGMDVIVVNPEDVANYLGVKPGVDMPILHNNVVVGAIGVTGFPKDVESVIAVAKMSIEVMLDYEIYKENAAIKNNERDTLFSLLLSTDPKDTRRLNHLAYRLQYDPTAYRIPILFTINDRNYGLPEIMRMIQTQPELSAQDFVFTSQEQKIVVFKTVRGKPANIMTEYRNAVNVFVAPVCSKLAANAIKHEYFVGTLQNNLANYKTAFDHCVWMLERNLPFEFFYDHVEEYLHFLIPVVELKGIFCAVDDLMADIPKSDMLEIVSALKQNNYNLVSASNQLHIHKNTLIFRMNKIKERLNINPMQSVFDKGFLEYYCLYSRSLKKYQSGNARPAAPDPFKH